MRKVLFVVLLFHAFQAQADQLAWLSAEDAEMASAYLSEQTEIVIWCACCDNDCPKKIKLTKVSYFENDAGFYEVVIEGTSLEGEHIETSIDLAYVHVRKKNKYKCLGKVLRLPCHPCINTFERK